MLAIAALAFVAIFFFKVPFPLIVLGAGLVGMLGSRFYPGSFSRPASIAGDLASDYRDTRSSKEKLCE